MNIYHTDGWNIRRDDEVIRALLGALNATEAIARTLHGISYRPQDGNRGGGVHFIGQSRDDGGSVIIKVGALRDEVEWTQAIARHAPGLAANLIAVGMELERFTVGWLATRVIPYGPLGPRWGGEEFRLLMHAGARFQSIASAQAMPVAPRLTADRLEKSCARRALSAPPAQLGCWWTAFPPIGYG